MLIEISAAKSQIQRVKEEIEPKNKIYEDKKEKIAHEIKVLLDRVKKLYPSGYKLNQEIEKQINT